MTDFMYPIRKVRNDLKVICQDGKQQCDHNENRFASGTLIRIRLLNQ